VLPGAVVSELCSVSAARSVFELVGSDSSAGEHLEDGVDLGGFGRVRGACDRDLLIRELLVGIDERDRLKRLDRRAEQGLK
jgi:hypothetical protein